MNRIKLRLTQAAPIVGADDAGADDRRCLDAFCRQHPGAKRVQLPSEPSRASDPAFSSPPSRPHPHFWPGGFFAAMLGLLGVPLGMAALTWALEAFK